MESCPNTLPPGSSDPISTVMRLVYISMRLGIQFILYAAPIFSPRFYCDWNLVSPATLIVVSEISSQTSCSCSSFSSDGGIL